MRDHAPLIMSAGTLIGNSVKNADGEDLGKIEEIMLDRHSGHVAYAVLSFGGFLGMGDKLFALPWSQIRVDTLNKCCIVDIDKARLENAPGFDKDNWPSHADRKFSDSVYTYYDTEPYYATV